MAKLTIYRGLPGSGKNTRAERAGGAVVSADEYFDVGGRYTFDASKLGAAHMWCQRRVAGLLAKGDVSVCNTFVRRSDLKPYRQIAIKAGALFEVVSIYDGGLSDRELSLRNVHGVGEAAIRGMRARWDWVIEDDPTAADLRRGFDLAIKAKDRRGAQRLRDLLASSS